MKEGKIRIRKVYDAPNGSGDYVEVEVIGESAEAEDLAQIARKAVTTAKGK